VSPYLDRYFNNGLDANEEQRPRGSDAGTPPGNFTVSRNRQDQDHPDVAWNIPEGHNIDCTIRAHGRDAVLVHGPKREPGSSGCIVITSNELFAKWSLLMQKPRCSVLASCRAVDYPERVPIRVRYDSAIAPIWHWIPMGQVPDPANDPNKRPNPYPPVYVNPDDIAVDLPCKPGADENP
jgi:hypothetical protein